jgi:hypothetical protein
LDSSYEIDSKECIDPLYVMVKDYKQIGWHFGKVVL